MPSNWNSEVSRLLGTIEQSPISKTNKETINEFVDKLKANGRNDKTIAKHLYCLKMFLKGFEGKNFKNASRKDIEHALIYINGLSISEQTKVNVKISIKFMYKQIFGNGDFYPEQVAWVRTTLAQKNKLLPEDILTEDEVLRMINAANNVRDKAIIGLLYDSGIRAGELLSMRKKDVNLNTELAHIMVNGKTGPRKIPIMFSVPMIAQYLNLIKDKGPEDNLWWNLAQSHVKGILEYPGLKKMITEVGNSAKIGKRIYPHLFRHSRASNYANKLTEQQLKAFFGWTGGSSMAATYVHLSGRDIDNAVLQANGQKPIDNVTESKLKVKVCQRCQFSNGTDSKYCNRCALPLDLGLAMEIQNKESGMKEAIAEALKDPKAIEEIVHTYLLMQAKKGKNK